MLFYNIIKNDLNNFKEYSILFKFYLMSNRDIELIKNNFLIVVTL
jgi:hypothetical protein